MRTLKSAQYGLFYSISSIAVQVISLLLLPIYTKYMSQEHFGELDLLISVQSLMAIFIILGANSGINRFLFEFEDQNRTKNVVLTFTMAWGAMMCVFSLWFGDSIYQLVFQKTNPNGGFYINFLVFSAVLIGLTNIYLSYYTMRMNPSTVIVINVSRALVMVLATAYFIMVKHAGIYGALQAQLYTYAIILLGMFVWDCKNFRFAADWGKMKTLLKYTTGLLLGQTASWVYTLIDRYFLNIMMGLKEVAVYSMGYRVGMLMQPVFTAPFAAVFTAFKYKAYKEADAPQRFHEFYLYYNFFGLFCVLGLALFAKPIIMIMATPEYLKTTEFIWLIAFSYYLYGLNEFYSLGIHVANKSIINSFILVAGAVCNVALCVYLIPESGIMGAALATVISFLLMNLVNFFVGRIYLDLKLTYWEPARACLIATLIYCAYLIMDAMFTSLVTEIIFSIILCILYVLISYFAGMIPPELVKLCVSQMKKLGIYRMQSININHD